MPYSYMGTVSSNTGTEPYGHGPGFQDRPEVKSWILMIFQTAVNGQKSVSSQNGAV